MNISQTFIERPIATSLLMAAIALFGGPIWLTLHFGLMPIRNRK
jgi:multidrug efflux pump subunit AcrB